MAFKHDNPMAFYSESAKFSTADGQRAFVEGFSRQVGKMVEKVRALMQPVTQWNMRRRLARELRALDDRMLADIGVVRCRIPGTVKEAYPGTTSAPETQTPVKTFTAPVLGTAAGDREPANDTDRPLAA